MCERKRERKKGGIGLVTILGCVPTEGKCEYVHAHTYIHARRRSLANRKNISLITEYIECAIRGPCANCLLYIYAATAPFSPVCGSSRSVRAKRTIRRRCERRLDGSDLLLARSIMYRARTEI